MNPKNKGVVKDVFCVYHSNVHTTLFSHSLLENVYTSEKSLDLVIKIDQSFKLRCKILTLIVSYIHACTDFKWKLESHTYQCGSKHTCTQYIHTYDGFLHYPNAVIISANLVKWCYVYRVALIMEFCLMWFFNFGWRERTSVETYNSTLRSVNYLTLNLIV